MKWEICRAKKLPSMNHSFDFHSLCGQWQINILFICQSTQSEVHERRWWSYNCWTNWLLISFIQNFVGLAETPELPSMKELITSKVLVKGSMSDYCWYSRRSRPKTNSMSDSKRKLDFSIDSYMQEKSPFRSSDWKSWIGFSKASRWAKST